ncbi:hypothetical protein M3Y99_00422000 [Aphelenchoides fujianensis]|nr:hypothetical protein M3Y99_00422000 [Aphelenchoides fujianensis]
MHGHTPLLVLLAVLVGSALAGKPKSGGSAGAGQFTTAPQCKCKDIQDCAHDLLEKTNNPQCEPFIKKIGNSGKIRACLDKEQKEMEKLEKCVEKKVGPVGCTNDEHPKNLTIPMMPQMDQAQMEAQMAAQPTQPGQAPAEMGQYLMCVDNCAMQALERDSKGHRRQRRSSSPNCANKLRCALAPPDQKTQSAFEACERELNLEPQKRFKASCECLKGAGVKIECPK